MKQNEAVELTEVELQWIRRAHETAQTHHSGEQVRLYRAKALAAVDTLNEERPNQNIEALTPREPFLHSFGFGLCSRSVCSPGSGFGHRPVAAVAGRAADRTLACCWVRVRWWVREASVGSVPDPGPCQQRLPGGQLPGLPEVPGLPCSDRANRV